MKIIKKANGKVGLKVTKKEWIRIGQSLGLDTSGLGGAGGAGGAPGGDRGGDMGGSGLGADTGSGLGDDSLGGDTGGEDPKAKIKRLMGEMQSALDELGLGDDDTGEGLGASDGGDAASTLGGDTDQVSQGGFDAAADAL